MPGRESAGFRRCRRFSPAAPLPRSLFFSGVHFSGDLGGDGSGPEGCWMYPSSLYQYYIRSEGSTRPSERFSFLYGILPFLRPTNAPAAIYGPSTPILCPEWVLCVVWTASTVPSCPPGGPERLRPPLHIQSLPESLRPPYGDLGGVDRAGGCDGSGPLSRHPKKYAWGAHLPPSAGA